MLQGACLGLGLGLGLCLRLASLVFVFISSSSLDLDLIPVWHSPLLSSPLVSLLIPQTSFYGLADRTSSIRLQCYTLSYRYRASATPVSASICVLFISFRLPSGVCDSDIRYQISYVIEVSRAGANPMLSTHMAFVHMLSHSSELHIISYQTWAYICGRHLPPVSVLFSEHCVSVS